MQYTYCIDLHYLFVLICVSPRALMLGTKSTLKKRLSGSAWKKWCCCNILCWMESFLHTLENTLQTLFLYPTRHKQKFHWNLLKLLLSVGQHLPSSTNIYLPYQFEQPHMYCFESRLEVSDAETPHALGSEDGFQYIQHEVPDKSRCQIKQT